MLQSGAYWPEIWNQTKGFKWDIENIVIIIKPINLIFSSTRGDVLRSNDLQ
jgi:hypothetical protein